MKCFAGLISQTIPYDCCPVTSLVSNSLIFGEQRRDSGDFLTFSVTDCLVLSTGQPEMWHTYEILH